MHLPVSKMKGILRQLEAMIVVQHAARRDTTIFSYSNNVLVNPNDYHYSSSRPNRINQLSMRAIRESL